MPLLPLPYPTTPRTTCGATPRVQVSTLAVVTVFITVLVLLGQPLTIAAGIAGWLVVITMPSLGQQAPAPGSLGA